ncbi:MAG: hypothetical protein AB1589_19635 [Cyanobacteriota bacterium]
MKNLKSTTYTVFILALLLGLVAIALGLVRFTVWIEPQSPDLSSLPVIEPPTEPVVEKPEQPSPAKATVSPTLPPPATSPSNNPDPKAVAAREGALRVSNPTDHPIRLALLEQKSSGNSYQKPAHWDFAPMEGGSQGLILSLPQEQLKLKKGDILVAFAQDGSRLYWGPYVLGETPSPVWNQQKGEWQLVLYPSP